jgi:hypothetical protein
MLALTGRLKQAKQEFETAVRQTHGALTEAADNLASAAHRFRQDRKSCWPAKLSAPSQRVSLEASSSVSATAYERFGPMESVPPRGSGWVSFDVSSVTDPPPARCTAHRTISPSLRRTNSRGGLR